MRLLIFVFFVLGFFFGVQASYDFCQPINFWPPRSVDEYQLQRGAECLLGQKIQQGDNKIVCSITEGAAAEIRQAVLVGVKPGRAGGQCFSIPITISGLSSKLEWKVTVVD